MNFRQQLLEGLARRGYPPDSDVARAALSAAERRSRILDAAGITDSDLGHRAQEALDEIAELSDDVVDGLIDMIYTALEQVE